MKKPTAKTQQEKTEIEQLSQAELVELVLGLQKIIQELEEKLAIATGKSRTTSETSSQPPSLDLIQKSEKAKVEGEEEQKKKPGGQPGHQGTTRKGFGRVDRYEISQPEICQWCGSRELSEAISHQTQQVACLIAKPIEVVEYQTQSCKCLECGGIVRGALPEGIVPGQDMNINLQALLVWLGNYGHLSYEKQQEFAGVLSSDDFSVYNGCHVKAQQKCLAHLLRHFKKVLGLPGKNNNAAVATVFIELINEAFGQHRLWREQGDLVTYFQWAIDFKARLNQALQTWLSTVGYAAGLLLRSLRDQADQWWYFLHDPNVPPDNNLAERSLRLAVTKRKVAGGSRSMARFKQTANLLSVIQTCRFQARSAMAFFREAISAHSCDFATPSLIPLSST